jgi:CRP-like cAMP-binding protein
MGLMLSPEILRRFPLFAGFNHELLKNIAMAGEAIRLKKGTCLFHEGDDAEFFYLIIQGAVELQILLDCHDLSPVGLSILEAGDFIGWSAVAESSTYCINAVVLKRVKLARIRGERLAALLSADPEAGFEFMVRLSQLIGRRLDEVFIRFASLVESGRWQHLSRPNPFHLSEGGRFSPR